MRRPMLETVIEPRTGVRLPDLKETWQWRHLGIMQARRDLAVRYRAATLGSMWTLLQPLIFMGVFAIAFSRFGNAAPGGTPYHVFVLAGLVPWFWFAAGLTATVDSLAGQAGLFSRVYFPRLLLPVAALAIPTLDAVIGFGVLLAVAAFSNALHGPIYLLPLFLASLAIAITGWSLLFCAANALRRDVRVVLPFLLQAGMLLSPIAFATTTLGGIPGKILLWGNPVAGLVAGIRWALLGVDAPPIEVLWWDAGLALVALLAGLLLFERVDRNILDVV